MANIQINHLNPVGSELFTDSESYLNALSTAEIMTRGGDSTIQNTSTLSIVITTRILDID